jgi:hypothetical protein
MGIDSGLGLSFVTVMAELLASCSVFENNSLLYKTLIIESCSSQAEMFHARQMNSHIWNIQRPVENGGKERSTVLAVKLFLMADLFRQSACAQWDLIKTGPSSNLV